jgi:glycosyltransferase involved in cell wall biosynthesis
MTNDHYPMTNLKPVVLHINTFDQGGGAEKFCLDFVIRSGVEAYMLVKEKKTDYEFIDEINKFNLNNVFLFLDKVLWKLNIKKFSLLKWFREYKKSHSLTERLNFTYSNLRKHPFYKKANIIHLHNIHGNYFDLDALKKIAKEKIIIWSLHDMWAFTGGESFVLENENYKIGKGDTPYNIYYPLNNPNVDRRDYYLRKKKKLYASISNKIVFVTGSPWLTECLKSSWVFNDKLEVSLIRESINTDTFHNNRKRDWLTARILIVNVKNYYKGTEILQNVFTKTKTNFDIYVIGNDIPINFSNHRIYQLEYVKTDEGLSELFNNIDILIFPSLQDNNPLMVSCAMSCGVCVIGTETSGIINQLVEGAGILFKYKDEDSLLEKIEFAVNNLKAVRDIGLVAEQKARKLFDSSKMYNDYKNLYQELLDR